jgi:hypothetical protein
LNLAALRSRLKKAQLVLGPVGAAVRTFLSQYRPAPIRFISFNFDYYSSTCDALGIFEAAGPLFLLRVECYLDDVSSSELLSASSRTGVASFGRLPEAFAW